jgi:DNA invertase Pin-like site-specific DNA recombinase
MNEKAVLYLRVSGQAQVEAGGLERQQESCANFARSRGFVVAGVFSDEGVSGTMPALMRPAFGDMLVAMTAQEATSVIVERADRLARDLIESELIIRHCAEVGIKIYCADSGEELVFSPDADPTRKLFRQIMGALAEWDKSVIVKKLRAGRDKVRREKGRCEGRKPFSGREIIKAIVAMHQTGWGLPGIADFLNTNFPDQSPAGVHWSRRTIQRIIQRESENHDKQT